MIFLHIAAVFSLLLVFLCFSCKLPGFSRKRLSVLLLFAGGLIIRLLFASFYHGFNSDISCFAAWAERMYESGPGAFYSPEVFTDYPPGYMYILYSIGALCHRFDIEVYSGLHLVLLKLPSIICDLVCGWLFYREASRKFQDCTPFLLTASYLFHPVILLNSSLWGQVDSVFTLMAVLLCLFLIKGKTIPAYVVFGIGILLKPQMLAFTPVLIAGILNQVFLLNFNLQKLIHHFLAGLGVILGMILLCLPFGLEKVLAQYINTLNSYAYAAVNACNFWGFLGLNWVSQDTVFLGLSCQVWGMLALMLITVFTVFLGLSRKKIHRNYPLPGAFVILSMFLFSVRMHERYLYPALILLLLSYLYTPIRQLAVCYGVFSILHLYNSAYVLFFYDPQNYNPRAPLILAVSLGMLAGIVFFYHTLYLLCCKKVSPLSAESDGAVTSRLSVKLHTLLSPAAPKRSQKGKPFTGLDLTLLLCVTLLYSCFALYDLGDRDAPDTAYHLDQGERLTLDFGEGNIPSSISCYPAPPHSRHFQVEGQYSIDTPWTSYGDIVLDNVFTWNSVSLEGSSHLLRLTLNDNQANIMELVFLDAEGNILTPLNAPEYAALFDESSLYPMRSTFRNGMYFDEIYHARTAYEFLRGLTTYENTHPPLGKILISLGIMLFGMNPFGWRIAGTLFGIAMVPLMYLFSHRLTRSTPLAALGSVLFAFDFMHFTQTRIATIDVYITFFVIFMYFFLYCYSQMSYYDTPLWKTFLPLGACGICMGLGIACKWTGIYAGIGLGILFTGVQLRRYREYLHARIHPEGSTEKQSHASILKTFPTALGKTLFFCCIFFAVIPAIIYLMSYLPFENGSNSGLFARMLANQQSMLQYHSNLESTHPYSSVWYEWPAMIRPIWYYSGIVSDSLREGISAFGNPLVWWTGIPAVLYLLYLAIYKKDRTATVLSISYLAQYLPWFFVTRITFIYHYFPSVPFVVLMILYSLVQWKKRVSRKTFLITILCYGGAVLGLFLLFYPVLSGQPIEVSFVNKFLRWFDSWVLVAQ